MVSQAKGGCKECGSMTHTKMYHKPKKPIQRTAIKQITRKEQYDMAKAVTKAIKEPKVKKTVKRATRSQLVKKLDTVFSQYIRQRDAIDGMATCVTCGDTKEWQYQQNGHFYSRGRYATRWEEMNCHTQCMRCNVFLKGNYINYTMYMIDRYGRQAVENLEIKSKSTEKITTVKLQEMIDYYKNVSKNYLQNH